MNWGAPEKSPEGSVQPVAEVVMQQRRKPKDVVAIIIDKKLPIGARHFERGASFEKKLAKRKPQIFGHQSADRVGDIEPHGNVVRGGKSWCPPLQFFA